MQNFLLHWKLHWLKYLSIIILSLVFVGSYFRLNISGAAGVVPVQIGQIGGHNPSAAGVYVPLYYPQSVVVDQNGNLFISDGNLIYKIDSSDNFIKSFGGYGTTTGKTIYIERMTLDAQGNVYVSDASSNKILKYDNDGNFLFSFGSFGDGDGQFDYPVGITVATSGDIYVADNGNARIQKFDQNGNYISQFGSYGSGDGQFRGPYSIAIATSGVLFVSDAGDASIKKFDQNGNFISKFGTYGTGDGQINNVYGDIALDSSGNIYLADFNNNRVQKFDPNGNFIKKYSSGASNISSPIGLTKDQYGNFYVLDGLLNKVNKFGPSGNLVLSIGTSTAGSAEGQFDRPTSFAVTASGNIYVADGYNNRIQKFDSNGNFISKFGTYGSSDGQFIFPTSIAASTSGDIYITDVYNNRIQKFDSNGNFISKFGTYGTSDGQFNQPRSVSLDGDGNIYVADAINNRIQKFDQNGNFISKFTPIGFILKHPGYSLGVSYIKWSKTGLYIINSSAGIVYKYDFSGNLVHSISDFGYDNNQTRYPADIFVDNNNTLYIADTGNSRISIYSVPPFIFSSSTASTTNSVTSFSWNTSREASGRVEYGLSTNYGTSSETVNNSPKTTTHIVSVTGLPTCTVINYRLISVDEDGSTATSSNYTTNTGGCVNMAPVISSVAVVASSTATSTVTNSTITLTVPPSVSATSSNIVFQANTIDPTAFYQTASVPSGKIPVKSEVFHLAAVSNTDNTIVSTFQAPIAVSISYSPEDLNGIDPNTLTIYRYDSSSWYPLSNCSTDTSTHTVTCYTTHFSDFALFAVPKAPGGAAYYYQRGDIDSPSTIQRVEALRASASNTVAINTNPVSAAINSLNKTSLLITNTLYYGLFSNEVSLLQSYLATLPGIYPEALVTGYYGKLTQKAVQRYQCKYNIVCEGSPKGTGWGVVGKRTREEMGR